MECINIQTKINSIIIHYYSYVVIQSKVKLKHWNTNTLTLAVTCMYTHTHTHTHNKHTQADSAHLDRKCRQHPSTNPAHPGKKYIYKNNNNSQPGAGASFSVNRLNELSIWLSLWASKLIQFGLISVCTKSVSARPPYIHFGGVVELWSRLTGCCCATARWIYSSIFACTPSLPFHCRDAEVHLFVQRCRSSSVCMFVQRCRSSSICVFEQKCRSSSFCVFVQSCRSSSICVFVQMQKLIFLCVCAEMQKFIGSLFFSWDVDMYEERMVQRCRTSSICALLPLPPPSHSHPLFRGCKGSMEERGGRGVGWGWQRDCPISWNSKHPQNTDRHIGDRGMSLTRCRKLTQLSINVLVHSAVDRAEAETHVVLRQRARLVGEQVLYLPMVWEWWWSCKVWWGDFCWGMGGGRGGLALFFSLSLIFDFIKFRIILWNFST